MATIANPTIVVSWGRKQFPFYYCFAALEAVSKMEVRLKGAGFNPNDSVSLTFCEKNLPLGKAVANSCGAFEVYVVIPPDIPMGPVTVKAWVKEEVRAVWPLDIVKVLPKPPC